MAKLLSDFDPAISVAQWNDLARVLVVDLRAFGWCRAFEQNQECMFDWPLRRELGGPVNCFDS